MTAARAHFGAWLGAYVDGELTAAQAARVHAHLPTCAECSGVVAAQREARNLVATADVEAAPDLAARILAAVPEPSAVLPPVGSGPPPPLSWDAPDGGRVRRSGRRTAALSLAAAAGVTGVLVLGGTDGYRPDPSRAASLEILAAAPTSVSRTDLVSTAGWIVPTRSMSVAGVSLTDGDRSLMLRLESADGHVVIEERKGHLDPLALGGAAVLEIGEHTVFVLESDPWHAVWEVDGTIIEAYGDEDVRIRDVVEGLTSD